MAPKGPLGLAHLVNFHSSALLFRYDFFEKSLAPMISKNAIQIGSKFRLFGGVAPKGSLGRAHLVNFHSTAPVFRSVSMGKSLAPMISKNAIQFGSKIIPFGGSNLASA